MRTGFGRIPNTAVILGFGTGRRAGLFLYPPRTLAGGAPCSCKKYWLLRQRQLEFTFLKREGIKS